MKRKIVQHGPSTLTISLPARWVRDKGVKKGDEVNVESLKHGLYLTVNRGSHHESARISVRDVYHIIPKAVAALYKYGYDEVIVEYKTADELERIHHMIRTGCVGFEIVDETRDTLVIRKVSDPSEEEFKPLFRRLFHFLVNTAADGLEAGRAGDAIACGNLILRDENINKLADFLRRMVNRQQQQHYRSSSALYHVIEQLEKIGDDYKRISAHIADRKAPLSDPALAFYAQVNRLLNAYHELFFKFNLKECERIYLQHAEIMAQAPRDHQKGEEHVIFYLKNIAQGIYDLLGATMVLHL